MKQLFLIIAISLLHTCAYGQPPKKFNYQGIARNSSGQPLANQALGLRLSILDSNANGPVRYAETHAVMTNAYGLYNVAVGSGTIVTKEMDSVAWGAADKYLLVEIDPTGGTSYTFLGATQLLSVPYSMYSAQSQQGIASAASFSGQITTIAANSPVWVFAGPTTTVTTTLAQSRIIGSASGVIGLPAGGPILIKTGMCYQLGAGVVTNFVGSNYTEFHLTTMRTLASASSSVTVPPGTYTVGFCVLNLTASIISNNDYVTGWVIVTQ